MPIFSPSYSTLPPTDAPIENLRTSVTCIVRRGLFSFTDTQINTFNETELRRIIDVGGKEVMNARDAIDNNRVRLIEAIENNLITLPQGTLILSEGQRVLRDQGVNVIENYEPEGCRENVLEKLKRHDYPDYVTSMKILNVLKRQDETTLAAQLRHNNRLELGR